MAAEDADTDDALAVDGIPTDVRRRLLARRLAWSMVGADRENDHGEMGAQEAVDVAERLLDLRGRANRTRTQERHYTRLRRRYEEVTGKPLPVGLADARAGLDEWSVKELAPYLFPL